jgi:hypothetical protein
MGVQKHYKNLLQNNSCRKVFTKKSTKNPKRFFSRFLFITLFFSRFLASDPPTHHRGHRFFWGGPLWQPVPNLASAVSTQPVSGQQTADISHQVQMSAGVFFLKVKSGPYIWQIAVKKRHKIVPKNRYIDNL